MYKLSLEPVEGSIDLNQRSEGPFSISVVKRDNDTLELESQQDAPKTILLNNKKYQLVGDGNELSPNVPNVHPRDSGPKELDTYVKEKGDQILCNINPEYFRLVTWGSFWAFVLIAVIITNASKVDLANTPFVIYYGYNNICTMWDYLPTRPIMALLCPLLEVPLVSYIVTNHFRIRETYIEGKEKNNQKISDCKMRLMNIFLPIMVLCAISFRLIFIMRPDDSKLDFVIHTLIFHMIMIAFSLLCIENYWFDLATDNLPFSPKYHCIHLFYVVALILVSIIKMLLSYFLFHGHDVIDHRHYGWVEFLNVLDKLWFVFNAVIPMGYAWVNRNKSKCFRILIGD